MIDYIFNNTDCIFYFYPYLFLRNIIYIFRSCCHLFLKKKKQMLKIYFCKFYFRVLKNKIVCYATCTKQISNLSCDECKWSTLLETLKTISLLYIM